MPAYDAVVIGTSAGGVAALIQVIGALPASFPLSIFIVIHVTNQAPSLMPEILTREGEIPAVHPQDMERIEKGKIYLAPPNHHLLIRDKHIELSKGAKVNHSRPSIDRLFISAAHAYNQRLIGVVLTGMLDDGSLGLAEIKRYGGTTIVQEPTEALFPQMPLNAIRASDCDYVLTLDEISKTLIRLVEQAEAEQTVAMNSQEYDESRQLDNSYETDPSRHGEEVYEKGKPSVYGCPDCGGVLAEMDKNGILHYVCRIGHTYSVEWLLTLQSEAIEKAFWTALRGLEESASFARHLAQQANGNTPQAKEQQYLDSAIEYERQAEILRNLLLG